MKRFLILLVLFAVTACSGKNPQLAYLQTPVPIQDTIGVDLDGNEQNIDQYRGKVLLIDFWATWCGPCLVKFPHMREIKTTYAERPFEILGISADYDPSDITTFLKDNDLPWDIWFAGFNQGVVKEWNISEFPTVYLVDHTGMIVARDPSDQQLDAMLVELVTKAEQAAKKE